MKRLMILSALVFGGVACGSDSDDGGGGGGSGGASGSSGGSAGSSAGSGGSGGSAGGSGGAAGSGASGGAAGSGGSGGSAGGSGSAGAAGAAGSAGSGGSAGAAGSAGSGGSAGGPVMTTCAPAAATSGNFTMLTYNVAGLPQGISMSNPEVNLPLISPLLNSYTIVAAQENFTFSDYPQKLRSAATHMYISTPKPAGGGSDLGDGLNRFSDICFQDQDLHREAWTDCFGTLTNGADCLTSKGFSVVEHHLADGVVIDIYNLHMDAGGSVDDQAARANQVDQILADIATRSANEAIIVAGDTNLGASEPPLDKLLNDAGLTDTCRALSCGDERIDRIMFRSSTNLTLTPSNWRIATEFVDGGGTDLSDHKAVAVDFAWQTQ